MIGLSGLDGSKRIHGGISRRTVRGACAICGSVVDGIENEMGGIRVGVVRIAPSSQRPAVAASPVVPGAGTLFARNQNSNDFFAHGPAVALRSEPFGTVMRCRLVAVN